MKKPESLEKMLSEIRKLFPKVKYKIEFKKSEYYRIDFKNNIKGDYKFFCLFYSSDDEFEIIASLLNESDKKYFWNYHLK